MKMKSIEVVDRHRLGTLVGATDLLHGQTSSRRSLRKCFRRQSLLMEAL